MIVTSYLNEALSPEHIPLIVDGLIERIQKTGVEFEAIAFRGMSGALIAPVVAYKLKKHLILVRKKSEKRHSGYLVEGLIWAKNYIIIDDLICTGQTLRETIKSISDRPKGDDIPACEAIFLYASERPKSMPFYSHAGERIPIYSMWVKRNETEGLEIVLPQD